MRTYEERMRMIRLMLEDPDLELSIREVTIHLYYAYRFELALKRKEHHRRLQNKYAKLLNDNIDVFALRKKMKHL